MKNYGLIGIISGGIFALLCMQTLISKNDREQSMQKINLISPSFIANSSIPKEYAYTECGGANQSPELRWDTMPKGAQSLVLIVDDPDAPSAKNPRKNPWVHWLVYDLPSTIQKLENSVDISKLGGKEGSNDYGNSQYDGPCPPAGSGPHRYFFKLYALDIPTVGLSIGASKSQLLQKMEGHILAQGEVMGIFEIK